MRNVFADTVVAQCNKDNVYFLTGDLGFMALEGVRLAFGNRFINAGVAEQNMIGVAAGLASEGNMVFVYSIAPFCYARPFEQIRNDICPTRLPVCLVGNGGGYAYGHMGPTHHALEDCAVMNSLGVRVLVPAFGEDIPCLSLSEIVSPTYLRLGYDQRPKTEKIPLYSPWRLILGGHQGAIAALGPMVGLAWKALADIPIEKRPSVWAVTEFVREMIPNGFWDQVKGDRLYVIEEHVSDGGLGMNIALEMARMGVKVSRFVHRYALRYPTGRFGSQLFHLKESGLDVVGIREMVTNGK